MTETPATGTPRPALVEGHAFEALDWHELAVEGADWAIEMAVTPRVVNSSGVLQGGLLATLVDMVAGTALVRGRDPYVRSATTEMHISFLEAARQGPVVATAHVLRRGRRTAVVRVDVRDRSAEGILVATATLTFAVKRAEGA